MLKTYTLYMTYAGFLHFGFSDGIYLKYGGKKIRDIQKSEIDTCLKSFFMMEIVVAVIVAAISRVICDQILLFFSVGFICCNFIALLQNLYQATGEFKSYGRALNAQSLIVLTFNIILIFFFHIDNYVYFILLQILVGVIVSIFLTIQFNRKNPFVHTGRIMPMSLMENIRSGFVLMIGNLSSKIFTSIDRWFVKILMLTVDFAQYSFAVSIDTMVNTFITPITVTLYNRFCVSREEADIKRAKNILLIWVLLVIAAAFPAKLIIELFLDQYKIATTVMFFLLASQVFAGLVKGIYVNYYKAEKKQNIYFKQTIVMIVFSIAANLAFYLIMRNMQSFAVTTLITNIIWLLVCEISNKNLRFGWTSYFFCGVEITLFIILGTYCNPIMGLILYLLSLLVLTRLMMKDCFYEILEIVKKYAKRLLQQKR